MSPTLPICTSNGKESNLTYYEEEPHLQLQKGRKVHTTGTGQFLVLCTHNCHDYVACFISHNIEQVKPTKKTLARVHQLQSHHGYFPPLCTE